MYFRVLMSYDKPRIETYGSVEELTENFDDGYGDHGWGGDPWPW